MFITRYNIIFKILLKTLLIVHSSAGIYYLYGTVKITEISNAQQFYNIRDDLDGNFRQTNHIDLSDYSDNQGWVPIGDNTNNFTGSYDGNGFTITGLYIDRQNDNIQGLFGFVYEADIRNVSLIDVDVTGKDFVGGLAGVNRNSKIVNCYTTGNVSGHNHVGGLIGFSYQGSSVDKCFSQTNVIGNEFVGGLIGRNSNSSTTIKYSYSQGDVKGNSKVGGLVGENFNAVISDCYSLGQVVRRAENNEQIGGFCGHNYQGKILNSYSTGSITYANAESQPINTGFCGAVNTEDNYQMEGNYWDVDSSRHSSTRGAATGKTTDDMTKQNTFSNWDFDDIWAIDERISYPYLKHQSHTHNDFNIPLRKLVPDEINLYTITFHEITATFNAGNYNENTEIKLKYTTNSSYYAVQSFPRPENLGAYYKFHFADHNDLINGVSFQLQLPAIPNNIWYRYADEHWIVIDDYRLTHNDDLPEYTFTVCLDNLLPAQRNQSGFIEFTADSGGGQTLPVELSSFTAAETADKHVKLKWTAETESNMLGYNIYRNKKPNLADAAKINFAIIPAHNNSLAIEYSFIDTNTETGKIHFYWLQANDLDLTNTLHGPIPIMTSYNEEQTEVETPPIITQIKKIYPNPSNIGVNIVFSLAETGKVNMHIYNNKGQLVKTLLDEQEYLKENRYTVFWNGKNNKGYEIGSGMYWGVMEVDDYWRGIFKVVIVK